jgi:hypothetical protein
MYVYICLCIYMHVCIYTYIFVYMYTYLYMSLSLYIYDEIFCKRVIYKMNEMNSSIKGASGLLRFKPEVKRID